MRKRKIAPEDASVEPLAFTIPEVAVRLRIGRNKVYDLIAKQGMPAATIGGVLRVPAESLKMWLKEQEQNQSA